ncbi:hypothetical protein [Nonomuraea zeae]|uniref:hypothetical protein n=1 Tax=Nonomuraea zeae TaxID=1642303 RepID=UPI00360EC02C
MRHDDAFPWPIAREHSEALISKYIRSLDLAAKTGGGDAEYLHQAFKWANNLIERHMDIAYSPTYAGTELIDQGGYYEISAQEDDWYVKRLRDAALEGGRKRKQ